MIGRVWSGDELGDLLMEEEAKTKKLTEMAQEYICILEMMDQPKAALARIRLAKILSGEE